MMEGTMKMKAPSNPCCWVTASDEIINPTPTADSRNSAIPVYKRQQAAAAAAPGTRTPPTRMISVASANADQEARAAPCRAGFPRAATE